MRRRTNVLVLVLGAAAALLLSAPALGAAWLSPETAALSGAPIQHSPAIAVDPGAPAHAVVVADDSTGAPPSAYPRTAATSNVDWSAASWTASAALIYPGSASAGQADIAWGLAQDVYVAELRSSAGQLCMPDAGIYFFASPDSGASWNSTPLTVASGSTSGEVIEPAIAVDRGTGRVYVAYSRLEWGASCGGAPDSSQIWLAYSDNEGFSWTTRRVSPLAGTARYRSPALDVLPDGRVIVAFRNDATPSPQIETETCVSPTPMGSIHYCGSGASAVGPSTVVGDASAPGLVSGLVGAPTPSVVAAGGRTVVAWHASAPNGVRAFAAMSTDGGATFGPAQQIDPSGPGNQVAPQLAAAVGGRVDVAYLWDSGGGSVQATAVSAGPPLPGATTEAWAQPVVVQAVGASSAVAPINGQAAPLGRGLGVATAALPGSPLPATVVAFTNTQSGQDVHVVGLLHGTTSPAIGAQTVTASKNTTTIVHVNGSDEDGDPLTWSTGAQPSATASKVDISDPARGEFAFRAANVKGSDTFEAVANDGAGHEARAMINVNIVNDPPEIKAECDTFFALEDTPLEIDVLACVKDANQDPLTVDLDGAQGGKVERVAGTWRFVPAPHSIATGSFVLHVSDNDPGSQAVSARMTVVISKAVGKVTLDVTGAGKRVVAQGMPLRFAGSAQAATGPLLIAWNFGDGTPVARGPRVAHRFRREGAFTVKATASSVTVQIRVLVRRRAVELVGPPRVVDGVMHIRVRTRAAGKLSFRVDSRSRVVTVPAGTAQRTLQLQVTTGPLVRLSLRLQPSKKTVLKALSLRRLVLVSPPSAG